MLRWRKRRDPNFFTRVKDFIGEFTDKQNVCFHRAMELERKLVFNDYNDNKKTYHERFKYVMQKNLRTAEQQHKQVEDILKA